MRVRWGPQLMTALHLIHVLTHHLLRCGTGPRARAIYSCAEVLHFVYHLPMCVCVKERESKREREKSFQFMSVISNKRQNTAAPQRGTERVRQKEWGIERGSMLSIKTLMLLRVPSALPLSAIIAPIILIILITAIYPAFTPSSFTRHGTKNSSFALGASHIVTVSERPSIDHLLLLEEHSIPFST